MYKILTQNCLYDLETLVNSYIGAGWLPQGGVCESENWMSQAMVRPEVLQRNISRVEVQ